MRTLKCELGGSAVYAAGPGALGLQVPWHERGCWVLEVGGGLRVAALRPDWVMIR